ncbi:FAD-dependent monooxygenase [Leptospira andrefontaineae]|uniref:FAD-dependent monooxygenase n=1 Tax=Leptospira andrefontaineae TaxID=2484976 RepID=UPI003CC5E6C8
MFPIISIIEKQHVRNAIAIGANPTGLFASFLLSHMGIPTLIIDEQRIVTEDRQIFLNQNDLTIFEEILLRKRENNKDSVRTIAESFEDLRILYSQIKNKDLKNISKSVCSISRNSIESILRKKISFLDNVTIIKPSAFSHNSGVGKTILLDLEIGNLKFKIQTSLLVICNDDDSRKTDFHSLFLLLFETLNNCTLNKSENQNATFVDNFYEIYTNDCFSEKARHE